MILSALGVGREMVGTWCVLYFVVFFALLFPNAKINFSNGLMAELVAFAVVCCVLPNGCKKKSAIADLLDF